MKIWYNSILDPKRHCVEFKQNRIRIGRNLDNDIVLDSQFVAGEAIVLYRRNQNWEIISLGLNGCRVGDKELHGGETCQLTQAERIVLWPYTLDVDVPTEMEVSSAAARRILNEQASDFVRGVHLDLLSRMNADRGEEIHGESDEYLVWLENNLQEISRLRGLLKNRNRKLVDHLAGECVRSEILTTLLESSSTAIGGPWEASRHWSRMVTAVPDRETELQKTVKHVWGKLSLGSERTVSERIELIEQKFWSTWEEALTQLFEEPKQYLAQRFICKQVKDVIFGYGPLEDLLRTPTISEIMVVDRDHIYVEKGGVLENSGRRFLSDAVTQSIIERIVSKVGRRIDKSQPLVDARLTDGSRVNAVIPPLAVSGPCLTIRKFPQRALLIDDLVQRGALTRTVAEFLRAATVVRKNILISGGTGTGKTTLLNCLSDFIPDRERIVTIEDTAELQLKKEHVVRLETKKANIEGAGEYSIRDLVKNALRMRPDRIIVGECRGGEALDMLQAMNTGHDGSMTTIHANSSADVILRLEVLVQMASPLPIDSIHRQIGSAVDIIVQLSRLRDGRRIVSEVTEVVGTDEESSRVQLKTLFRFINNENGGQLYPTGRLPTFMDRLIEKGLIKLESFYL